VASLRSSDRTVIPDALHPIVAGELDPTVVTTRVVDWEDAAEALLTHDWTKLVVRRDARR
jgi:hypothetical protein